MIHPAAIEEFLEWQRDSHAWVKKVPEADLDQELRELDFRVARPELPLRKHQKACALLGIAYPRFGFWLDMGTGKTRLILELLRYFIQAGRIKRALILLPSEDGVYSWERQIKHWQIDVPYVALGNMPTADKWREIEELESGLIIMGYPGLQWLVSKKKVDKKSGKARLNWDDKLCKKLSALIDAYVADESTKLGNQDSLPSRIVNKISKNAEFYWSLAGRPIGRKRELIWNQQFLIDRGESLGETLGLFRAGFFKEKRGYFKMYEYKFDESKEELLASFMQHRSITYASSECQDLPKVTRIVERVGLPEDIEAYYKKAVQAFIAAKGNYTESRNIFLRLRQMSSGFVGFKDDETGERAQVVFPKCPKLDRLIDLIEAVPKDRKAVVFYEYTFSGRRIVERIEKELGIKCGWLWSGAKDRASFQDRFDDDPKLRVAVVNNAIGSMVLNLQRANYAFVYEASPDPITDEQARKRCFREGQTLPGFLYYLISRGTADQKILDFHEEGEDAFRGLFRDPYGIVD